MPTSTNPKKILVTGATSGIGKALAQELHDKGHEVILCARNLEKAQRVKEEGHLYRSPIVVCDLSEQKSVESAVQYIKKEHPSIDVLINNAGHLCAKRHTNSKGYEVTFAANHLGPFQLTNELIDNINERIINVTSSMHKIGKIPFKNIQARKFYFGPLEYANSKLANILFTYELSKRVNSKGIDVNCIDPGFIKTSIGTRRKDYINFIMRCISPCFASPESGAKHIANLATSFKFNNLTGLYYVKNQQKQSSKKTYDKQLAQDLWKLSEYLIEKKYE